MPSLCDAHLHLQHPALKPHLSGVLREMEALPVCGAVVNGTTEADWPTVRELAKRYPWVIPAYGLHPWYLSERSPQWETTLYHALEADPLATLGEIGLDRWMRHPDPEGQREVFTRQMAMAVEYRRPASIHCLRAWGTLRDLLRSQALPACGFLLHAYGGPTEMVEEFAAMGAYFSFSGYFLTPGKEQKLEPFRMIPRDRLLIETDAPSMLPPPAWLRHPLPPDENGTAVNHPANLAAVCEGLAGFLGESPEGIATLTTANFRRLFHQEQSV